MTASSIFICYRRSDSALYARNLYTDLKGRFGDHEIFMDLGVGLGEDFVTRIEQQIDRCVVLLVLIGPDWDSAVDEDGRRRIDDPEDLVRLEIETALARSVRVIPLFVRGANMPKADELPGSLAGLARRNGFALRDDGWEADVAKVTTSLRAMLGETRLPRRAPGLPGDGVWVAPPVVASFAATEPAPALAPEPAPDSRDTATASLSGRPRGEGVSRRARIAVAAGLVLVALAITLYLTFGVADKVRIGAIYTLTGDGESAGNESLRGVKLAVDYLNDDSYPDLNLSLKPGAGLPGLGGAKLELASRDVGGHRCRVQSVFEQLVIDGAAAVVGAYESTITQQAVVAANKLEVPLVNDTATSYGLTANDDNGKDPRAVCDQVQEDPTPSDWFFRVGGNDQQFAELFGKLIAAERRRGHSIVEVAVLYEGHDSFGSSGFQATLKVANELGVKTTPMKYLRAKKGDELRATPGCAKRRLVRDLRARVARLQRDRPDVVFALSYLDDAALVVQTMATRGYRPPAMLVYGAGYANPEFVARARAGTSGCGLDAAKPDGIISRSSGGWPTRGAAELKVAQMFKQRWGASITDTTARSFTATIALATAINAAGSTDPTRIRDAMRGLDISADQTILPDHGITFDPWGQNEGALAVLEQMVGGRYVTVYPPRESRRDVRWPLRKGFGM